MSITVFEGDFLRASRLDGNIVEVCLDRRNDPVNKLDLPVVRELASLVASIESVSGLRGVLLTSAKDAFLAGADISTLWSMFAWSERELVAFCAGMDQALTQLEDLPVPVVCAINGFALGGGFETALCSDYRVLAANGQVGFPEVSLGILPGAGGTVRMARLTDAATALEWVVGAKTYRADAALKAGVVDAVCEPSQLRATALAWLQRAIAGELDWIARRKKRRGSATADETAFAQARVQARKTARNYPAGLAVVDLMERSAPLARDDAIRLEAETFGKLMKTSTAKAMVGIFLSGQQLRKKSKSHSEQGRRVQRAAVLGAGIMGGGVAYTTAAQGMPVLLKDVAQRPLDIGIGEARKLLSKQVEGGRLLPAKAEQILASITPLLEFKDFDTVDVVVEAVVENLKVKQDLLAQVESLVKPGTVIASNTSSLSIAEISSPLKRPEDVVGMHFFNPVHLMPLVEVIRGPRSSEAAVATTVSYALAMGKTPLVVKDCPGFLVNRILGAYFTAFQLLVRDGADFVQIDRVMETFGWPMGPAYLLDVAGLDTLDKALAILGKAYPDVMGTDFPTVIQRLASAKRYGQKTGAGFFRYESDAKGKPRRSSDPEIAEFIGQVQSKAKREFSDDEILEGMMLAMILEAARCLDERVADSAIDIDAGMRLGTGFPAHHGGPLWYADTLGAAEVLRRCERYRSLGGLYAPGPGLISLGQRNRTFHSP